MCSIKATTKTKTTTTQTKTKKDNFNPLNLPVEILDKTKTSDVESLEDKVSVKPQTEIKVKVPNKFEKTDDDTVYKHILLKDIVGKYYAITLINTGDWELLCANNLIDNLTELEIFRKYIVIEFPNKLYMSLTNFDDYFPPLLKKEKGLEFVNKPLIENSKNPFNAAGLNVRVTEYVEDGVTIGMVNYTGDDDDIIKDKIQFINSSKIACCKQVNLLKCRYHNRNANTTIYIDSEDEIDNTLTFYRCYFQDDYENSIMTFKDVFGIICDAKLMNLNISKLKLFANKGTIERSRLFGTSLKQLTTLTLSKELYMEDASLEFKPINSKENNIHFSKELIVRYAKDIIMFIGSYEKTYCNEHLNLSFDGVGISEPLYFSITKDDAYHSTIYMDKIVLYNNKGVPNDCEILNIKKSNETVKYVTYVNIVGSWFPIGELINAYGNKSINGVILSTYLKQRDKIISSRSDDIIIANENNND